MLVAALSGNLSGCRNRRVRAPASQINLGDEKTSKQLLFGFYDVEQNSYRWTGRNFAVLLAPPPNPQHRRVYLHLKLFIPDSEIKNLGPMTLASSTPGYELNSWTFADGGAQEYISSIPSGALCTNLLPVGFSFDRATSPSPSDARELGAVAVSFALTPE